MASPFLPSIKSSPFNHIVDKLYSIFESLPDNRFGNNIRYTMADAAMGAFAVFFTQSPSFLDAQRTLQTIEGCNNTHTLFGMGQIPSDNHIRNLLDEIPPSELYPIFSELINILKASQQLDPYRSINNDLLIAMDGVQYFSSPSIHCKNCNSKDNKNGTINYSHTVITPVIVASENPRVIPLQPEFITPQDGHKKQDCENAAGKRWLQQYGSYYSTLGATILGDDLYCKQPLCKAILDQGLNFILVCKPDSHQTLYEWVEEIHTSQPNTLTVTRRHGKRIITDSYRWVNQVPLRDSDDALLVNWCELTTTNDKGKILYQNSFSTNHILTIDNITDVVRDGRARWKVENENNNTLKTKGYHLNHNFGHGKQFLSSFLATLNIIAFSLHTFLDIYDLNYQTIRKFLPRKTFFDDVRALTRYLCFNDWQALMIFMINALKLKIPDRG